MKGFDTMTDNQATRQDIASRLDELDRLQEIVSDFPPTETTVAILAAISDRKKALRLKLDTLT